MKRILIPVFILALALGSATAQEPVPKPEFDGAPVTDVLIWAQRSIGCGFMYEGQVLRDPATGKQRSITAKHIEPATRAEKTALLFELLRRCGLVAFEIGGLPGPSYQLYDAAGAAANAPLFDNPDKLGNALFAGLTIRLKRAAALEVAARVKQRLTPVGAVEVFETTQTLIVTDYRDRLAAAWEVAQSAENGAERVDDMVVRDYSLRNVPADRALAGLQRLREKNESWNAAAHQTANVLLFSGRRDELDRVAERLRLMDRHEERAEFAEATRTIKLIFLDAGAAVKTLRQMFEADVAADSVQIGSLQGDTVVFRGSEYDYRRAADTLKLLDQPPAEKK
jgi:type II secretory pathway component GspD/PulD (secretin)